MKRVILVQRNGPTNGASKNIRKLMELRDLAISANYKVVGDVTQTRRLDRKYQIGRGKVEELALMKEELSTDKIIFSNQLSATQIYNISETCKCEVIDKFQLILEIFAKRATTKRAKLQVELAKSQYELPKAKAIVSLLKKEERPGFMGLGSYEDSYEQGIRSRIHRIQKELASVQKDNESLRIKRHEHGVSIVALAGYTSAGKSTLFNALVYENVQVGGILFTTLLPITRALNIRGRRVLLTDTVGFIEDLPHWMIDAFRSTLNEIFLADIILLVVDASESLDIARQKLITSQDTCWRQIKGVPIITVLNKIDRITEDELKEQLENIGNLAPNPVAVSAKNGLGFDELKMDIYGKLPKWERDTVSLPMSEYGMSIVSWLFGEGIVYNISYKDRIMVDFEARDEIILKARMIEKG
ncbi:MAG: GTPase HflX [Tenericutes bacterium]|nr:MAG: GTPase HflX [Mycoplasmatota bacterium]